MAPIGTAERAALTELFGPFGHADRGAIADRLTALGFNKCDDCCLVPNCDSCGRCPEHDEAQ
jgi:arginyl-tRNA--protein-N-Asp/Glu arginylyltransferase